MKRLPAAVLLTVAALAVHGQPQESPKIPLPQKSGRRSAMMSHVASSLYEEQGNITARADRISAELKQLDRAGLKDTDWAKEWAGVYEEGNGLSENVSICLAPKEGVAFLNYGCTGLYGADHGDVVEALPDGLRLRLRYGDAQQSFLSDRVYFVKWDTERFLVPDWMMKRFVHDFNAGGFDRAGMMSNFPRLVTNRDAERQTPRGLPQLPPGYAKLLVTDIFKIRIAKVDPVEVQPIRDGVTVHWCMLDLEGGSNQGVFKWMEFRYPADAPAPSGIISVVEVKENTSKALFRVVAKPKETPAAPKAGDEVSTIAGRAGPSAKQGEVEPKKDDVKTSPGK